jgi:hypothetical protein
MSGLKDSCKPGGVRRCCAKARVAVAPGWHAGLDGLSALLDGREIDLSRTRPHDVAG